MPGGVFFDGRMTRRAGVLAKRDFSANQGRALTLNHLAVVAELPFLERNAVVATTSRRELEALASHPKLQNIANFVFRSSRDSRVGGGPSKVLLVSPLATTQASATLRDAGGDPAIVIEAREWGPGGNAVKVEVVASASPDDGFRDVTLTRGASVERYSRVGSGPVLLVWFDGAANPTAFTLLAKPNAAGTDGVFVAWTKSDITAAGWVPAGRLLADGPLSLQPSASGTHAATVAGIDRAGAPATENLTWTDSGESKTTTTAWSEVTAVTWTPAASATLTVAGHAFNLCAANGQDTLAAAAARINQFAADGYHASLELGRRIEIASIDEGALGTLTNAKSSAPAVTANALFALEALSSSSLVTATDGGDLRARLAPVTTNLTGGSSALEGSSDVAAWRAALAALRTKDAHTIVPLVTDADVHDEAREHARHMRGLGANECDVFVGAAPNETLAQLSARRQRLADHDLVIFFQRPERADHLGITRIFGPEWQALEAAAMSCALAPYEPLTWKRAGSDAYHHASLDPAASGELLLEHGLSFVFTDNANALKWERVVSTHAEDDDPSLTEPSANRGVNTMLRYLRAGFEGYVADGNADRTTILQRLKTLLVECVDLRYIDSFDEQSLDATEAGTAIVLEWDYSANIPKNQIVMRPRQKRLRLTIAV